MLDLNELEWKEERTKEDKPCSRAKAFGWEYLVVDTAYYIKSIYMKHAPWFKLTGKDEDHCKLMCQYHHNGVRQYLDKISAVIPKVEESEGRVIDLSQEIVQANAGSK